MTQSATLTSEETVAAVHSVLDEYEGCWSSLDFERLRSLWDDVEPDPIYVAEEHREALVGYPEIEAYWEQTKQPLLRARVRTWNRRVKQVSDDISVAFFTMRWMVELKAGGPMIVGASELVDGRQAPVGGQVRVTALFRRTMSGWRFIHYVEAPVGMLTQLAAMHESWVDDDFLNESRAELDQQRKGVAHG